MNESCFDRHFGCCVENKLDRAQIQPDQLAGPCGTPERWKWCLEPDDPRGDERKWWIWEIFIREQQPDLVIGWTRALGQRCWGWLPAHSDVCGCVDEAAVQGDLTDLKDHTGIGQCRARTQKFHFGHVEFGGPFWTWEFGSDFLVSLLF